MPFTGGSLVVQIYITCKSVITHESLKGDTVDVMTNSKLHSNLGTFHDGAMTTDIIRESNTEHVQTSRSVHRLINSDPEYHQRKNINFDKTAHERLHMNIKIRDHAAKLSLLVYC